MSTAKTPKGALQRPLTRIIAETAEPRPRRPSAISAMTSITPIVNVKKMYGMMKAAPPLAPAQNGNFQMAPMPIAEPAEARMKPRRELH